VPISGLSGDNILEPVGKKCPWYSGPTLLQILDQLPLNDRSLNGPLRIPILDVTVTEKGSLTKEGSLTAHGKIEIGSIRIGDKVLISPSGFLTQVSSILDHKNDSVLYARPGENVQIQFIHVEG
jgi:peptide chain release factor subunit 3